MSSLQLLRVRVLGLYRIRLICAVTPREITVQYTQSTSTAAAAAAAYAFVRVATVVVYIVVHSGDETSAATSGSVYAI